LDQSFKLFFIRLLQIVRGLRIMPVCRKAAGGYCARQQLSYLSARNQCSWRMIAGPLTARSSPRFSERHKEHKDIAGFVLRLKLKESKMKFKTIALAGAFALASTFAVAQSSNGTGGAGPGGGSSNGAAVGNGSAAGAPTPGTSTTGRNTGTVGESNKMGGPNTATGQTGTVHSAPSVNSNKNNN
jgi:hypothetical protein